MLAAGDLDPSFGHDGRVVADVPGHDQFDPAVVAIRNDGKLMLGGNLSGFGGAIARLNEDGKPDTEFDHDGTLISDATVQFFYVQQLVPLAGGMTLVAADRGVGRFLADGRLDPSFGTNGWFETTSPFWLSNRLSLQDDGRIVFAYHDANFVTRIIRLNTDGTRDLSFGDPGASGGAITPWVSSSDEVKQILVRADQRILVLLHASDRESPGTGRLALLQYLPDGTPDRSFGNDGRVVGRVFGGEENVSGIALNSSGGILVGGISQNATTVTRFKANGRFDRAFAERGVHRIVVADIPPEYKIEPGMIDVASDGTILTSVVSGFAQYAARLNADGSADLTFGTAGVARVLEGTVSASLARRDDGRILIARATASGFDIERLTADGMLDSTFGTGGHQLLPVTGPGDDTAGAVALQPDGKLLVASKSEHGDSDVGLVFRYRRDGSLDTTFGDQGVALLPFGASISSVRDIRVLPSGKIVVSGARVADGHDEGVIARLNSDGSIDRSYGHNGTNSVPSQVDRIVPTSGDDFVAYLIGPFDTVSRVLSDGSRDTSFADDGYAILNGFTPTDLPGAIVTQRDGKILLAGTITLPGKSYPAIGAMRLNQDGSPDLSFGDHGIASVDPGGFDASVNAITVQADGKVLLAGNRSSDNRAPFTVVRFTRNGRLDASFGNHGIVSTDLPSDAHFNSANSSTDSAIDLAVMSDGRILAIGRDDFRIEPSFPRTRVAVVRFNPDGSLDRSFGNFGRITTEYEYELRPVTSLLTADGRLTVVANGRQSSTGVDIVTLRYLLDNLNAVAARIDNGLLKVTGSAAKDMIKLAVLDGQLVITGVPHGFPLASFSKIQIDALAGNDTIDASASPVPVILNGGDGNDILLGGAFDDALLGNAGNDTLFGGRGSDTLHGNGGNDYISGGPGADQLFGDAGNDQLFALDAAIDVLDGGVGFDRANGDVADLLSGIEGLL